MPPLVSIITPTLNRAPLLRDAIESVRRQSFQSLEHLVLDGGSNDGTAELVTSYPGIVFFTERDRGLYDAVNKGIARARGEIIGWVNSDDRYVSDDVVAAAVSLLGSKPELDSVCGGIRIVDRGKPVAVLNDAAVKSLEVIDVAGAPGLINARFFRRRVFERIGTFDLRYRIAADKEFLLRAKVAGISTAEIPQVVYEYRQHEGSITLSGLNDARFRSLDECLEIAWRYWQCADSSVEVRERCRRWHGWLVGWAATIKLRDGHPRSALALALRGLRANPAWPWLFLSQLPSYRKWRHGYVAGAEQDGEPDFAGDRANRTPL